MRKTAAAKKTARKAAPSRGFGISTVTNKGKNPLVASIEKSQSFGRTENGALTHTTTLNAVLDFFAMGGALRNRSEREVENLFVKAICDDPLLALKCLFHTRNCRGGAGERKTFRTVLKYLGDHYPDLVRKNLGNVVHYGRFDDLFALVGTKCENDAFRYAAAQLDADFVNAVNNQKITLAAKWGAMRTSK